MTAATYSSRRPAARLTQPGDAANHPNLTMRGAAQPCNLELRSLGKGDILGLNDMYN